MTKPDLVDKIHANAGPTKDEAFTCLETVQGTIKKTFETVETVKITGVGSFKCLQIISSARFNISLHTI